jgi:hypothetical protein
MQENGEYMDLNKPTPLALETFGQKERQSKQEIVLRSRTKTSFKEDDPNACIEPIMQSLAPTSQGIFSWITWTPK